MAARKPAQAGPFALESETVLKWGGVALVVLAIGFAVSTAISRGWIGPELQLAGAVAISLALIAVGLRLQPRRLPWTHALCTGGVLALFTTVASNLFVDQTSNNVAFIAAACTALVGYALARRIPSEWVGAANLVGGIVAWLVIADGDLPFRASLLWFVALVAVALVLSLEKQFFALRVLAHSAGLLAILGMAAEAEQPVERLLLFAAAAALAASLVRVPSIGDQSSPWQELDIQLATVAAPWSLAVIGVALELDGDTSVGSTAIAIAVATLLVALGLRRWTRPAHFVSVLIGASVTLSIGLAVLLSTTGAFVALAVQGAGLVVLRRSLGRSVRVLVNAALLLILAAIVTARNMRIAWTDDASLGDDVAHLAIIVAIAIAAWQSRQRSLEKLGAACVLALTLLWLGSVLVHLPQGQAAVSVSWAIVGTAILVTGAMRKVPELGAAGLIVLSLTVAKLLTVDLQEVDTLWRAGLFFVVGLALMRVGFLLPRLTGRGGGMHDEPPST
jgi:hypothetical protein